MTTLILFHWSECGHCIEYMPIWDLNIKNNKNIDSIKIEANDSSIEQIKRSNENIKLDDKELTKILEWKKENVIAYPTISKCDSKTQTITAFTGDRKIIDNLMFDFGVCPFEV